MPCTCEVEIGRWQSKQGTVIERDDDTGWRGRAKFWRAQSGASLIGGEAVAPCVRFQEKQVQLYLVHTERPRASKRSKIQESDRERPHLCYRAQHSLRFVKNKIRDRRNPTIILAKI